MKKTVISVLSIIAVCGAGFWLYNVDPNRRLQRFRNYEASCINCRSQFVMTLKMALWDSQEKWFPRGGTNAPDSLAAVCEGPSLAGCFTSHALRKKLEDYFEQHGTLTYDLMCYRYNEGLRTDDPEDLIVFYYYKPTRWSSWYDKEDFVGRPVMTTIISPAWDFIPEAEFQRRQQKTLAYLKENNRTTRASSVPARSSPAH